MMAEYSIDFSAPDRPAPWDQTSRGPRDSNISIRIPFPKQKLLAKDDIGRLPLEAQQQFRAMHISRLITAVYGKLLSVAIHSKKSADGKCLESAEIINSGKATFKIGGRRLKPRQSIIVDASFFISPS